MKIGFLTGVLNRMDFPELVRWASEAGFDALEVASGPGSRHMDPERVMSEGRVEEIKRILEENGIEISSLAQYSNIVDPDMERRDRILKNLRMAIDLCSELGVGVLCTSAGMPVPGKDKMRTIEEDVVPVLSDLVQYASEKGVKIALENWYATNIQNLAHWERLFSLLPSENLGLNYDPSHLYWQQIDYIEAVERFGKRIFHTHAKDTQVFQHRLRILGNQAGGWWRYCIPGYGGIDWAALISALKAVGYDGVLSIEHEDGLLGPEEGLIKGLEFLRRLI
jgi:sugar phosphate isomerase/epimerase